MLSPYLLAMLASVAVTVLLLPWQSHVALPHVALFYVLMVVGVGSRLGRGAALTAALSGALLYAHVYVPPLFSLAITEMEYLWAAGVMLVVALLVGQLTASLKSQAEALGQREAQAQALYLLARALAASQGRTDIARATEAFLRGTARAQLTRLEDAVAQMLPPPPAGCAWERLTLHTAQGQVLGELCCALPLTQACTTATRAMLETSASLVAVALERSTLAEQAREGEVRRAEESLRASILAALSHDLRTPLTVLVGMADALALGKGSPERQRSMLESLRNQALSINQQVTNVLDMARLRSGRVELNHAWQPVDEVIGATLQLVRAQWREREISVDLPPDLPLVYLDAVLIERVLWNLLENAIKYSPADTPVELVARHAPPWLDIGVCDWGPGLPAGDTEALFELFCRGQPESTIPGVGLGLAIAREIAQAHGGTVLAENRLGGGACFRLRLPTPPPPTFDPEEDAG